MKKKILIGVILSCFLLLVTPCINSVYINYKNEELKSSTLGDLKYYVFCFMIGKIKDFNIIFDINDIPQYFFRPVDVWRFYIRLGRSGAFTGPYDINIGEFTGKQCTINIGRFHGFINETTICGYYWYVGDFNPDGP